MQGFIKLPREIIEHKVFRNQFDFRLLTLILANANFSDSYDHEGIILKKGQWVRSYSKLQQDLIWLENKEEKVPSTRRIRQSIARLTEYGFLSRQDTELGSLFSVGEVLIPLVFGHTEESNRTQDWTQEIPGTGHYKKNVVLKKNELKNYKEDEYINLSSKRVCPSFADVYHLCYGRMLTPIQVQDFIAYIEKDGVEEELLNFAFECAIKVSSHINYVRAIINNWISKGIRTKLGAEQEYNRQRGNKNGRNERDQYSDIDLGW